MPVKDRVYCST